MNLGRIFLKTKTTNSLLVKKKFTFLFLSFFINHLISAQTSVEKLVKGQVTTNNISPLENINITNTSTKVMVVSDHYGHFSILVKKGDILSFSNVNYESLRKFINKQEFTVGNVNVDLSPKSIELDEVIINENSNINAENLRIIPKGQVKLTSVERKIYTATNGTDAILNYFSGRTQMLKKEVNVEKNEILMAKLEYLFEDKYYIETLKIPEELIKGFQYYCVENVDFANSLKDKNKTMSMFLIVGLASEFNKNQLNNEK